jgi:kynurenine formamidase
MRAQRLSFASGCGFEFPIRIIQKTGVVLKKDSPIHKILLGNGVVLVEYLCKLNYVTKSKVDLITPP